MMIPELGTAAGVANTTARTGRQDGARDFVQYLEPEPDGAKAVKTEKLSPDDAYADGSEGAGDGTEPEVQPAPDGPPPSRDVPSSSDSDPSVSAPGIAGHPSAAAIPSDTEGVVLGSAVAPEGDAAARHPFPSTGEVPARVATGAEEQRLANSRGETRPWERPVPGLVRASEQVTFSNGRPFETEDGLDLSTHPIKVPGSADGHSLRQDGGGLRRADNPDASRQAGRAAVPGAVGYATAALAAAPRLENVAREGARHGQGVENAGVNSRSSAQNIGSDGTGQQLVADMAPVSRPTQPAATGLGTALVQQRGQDAGLVLNLADMDSSLQPDTTTARQSLAPGGPGRDRILPANAMPPDLRPDQQPQPPTASTEARARMAAPIDPVHDGTRVVAGRGDVGKQSATAGGTSASARNAQTSLLPPTLTSFSIATAAVDPSELSDEVAGIGSEIAGAGQSQVAEPLRASLSFQGGERPPAMMRSVAAQMADGLGRSGGDTVEIALSPKELGRVQMSMTMSDDGVSMSISTERPETHNLLRRHISLLEQEFRDLGYVRIGFSFAGTQSDGGDGRDAPTGYPPPLSDGAEPDTTAVPEPAFAATGLDIRV